MVEDEKDYTIYSKCAAEFIAVLLFVYIGESSYYSRYITSEEILGNILGS